MGEVIILELFSGIGGMHAAFNCASVPGSIVAAVDINTNANIVYKHNYSEINVLNNNVQKLTAKYICDLGVNTIFMSPPCQPFTRVGLKKDVADARTDALKHICDLLINLHTVDYILMENVKGFEESQARTLYTDSLHSAGFNYREFILSPHQFGIPNTRHRYYCIARRKSFKFDKKMFWEEIPSRNDPDQSFLIKDILEDEELVSEEFYLPDSVLQKRAWLLDIVTPESTNTICFTKAYTHYSEGTGSIFTTCCKEKVSEVFETLKLTSTDSTTYLELLKSLKLRYFTPREVLRLMCFPDSFTFPKEVTNRQKYRLLGNSINVLVVGELMKVLLD